MANRVLLGNRATGGEGLYVSQSGDDVLTTTNPLAFDSRAGESLIVEAYGQTILASRHTNVTYANTTYTANTHTITHGLGYDPAYAVRWCRVSDLDSNGIATQVFNPVAYGFQEVIPAEEEEEDDEEFQSTAGVDAFIETANTNIKIANRVFFEFNASNPTNNDANSQAVAVSWVIFKAENFLDGRSL